MSFMPRLSNLFFLPPRILPVFVCLFLLSAAIGLSRPAEAQSELPFGHGLLWQLEKEGAPTSYVFGTIHIADQRVLNLPDVVLDALNRSERVIFELVIDASVRATIAQSMVLTDGRTLAQILGPDLFEQSKAVAQSYGGGGVLCRLPFELMAPTQLFATHRPTLGIPSRADVVLAAVRQRIRAGA